VKNEANQIWKIPLFNGKFDVWKVRMRNFLMAQGVEVRESMIIDNMIVVAEKVVCADTTDLPRSLNSLVTNKTKWNDLSLNTSFKT